MTRFSIRRATSALDIAQAETLAHRLFTGSDYVDEVFAHESAWWWVALDARSTQRRSRVVAFAGLRPVEGERGVGYLSLAGVHSDARGAGLQRRLIRARAAFARRCPIPGHGMHTLITVTRPENGWSSTNLVLEGFRPYVPSHDWAWEGALYWYRRL